MKAICSLIFKSVCFMFQHLILPVWTGAAVQLQAQTDGSIRKPPALPMVVYAKLNAHGHTVIVALNSRLYKYR
jgi:hypothetical protein